MEGQSFLFLEITHRGKYGEREKKKFTSITALVFFQSVVNYIYAFVMSFVEK
jgi:hypothetical protein